MSFLHCISTTLIVLVPALVHAQSALGVPSDGTKLSGVGVISGWKCDAEGDITVEFNDGALIAEGIPNPVPMLYGSQRPDTQEVCGDTDNGFVAIWNWGELGDGPHTAKAYDNGVLFAEARLTVTTTGEAFLKGASGTCRLSGFPSPGETTTFEWNQSTQHMEMTDVEDTPII